MTMRSISLSRGMRIGLPSVILAAWALGFLGQQFDAQVVNADYYQTLAQANTSRTQIVEPPRGSIYFSDGSPAVVDAPRYDLTVRAGKLRLITVTAEQIRNLVQHSLADDRGDLRDALTDTLATDEPFVAEVAAATGADRPTVAKNLLSALEAVERRWVNDTTPQPFVQDVPRERWLLIAQRLESEILPAVSNWRAIDASVGNQRTYPSGPLAAAVVGTVRSLRGEDYEQLVRSGLAISQYSSRQKWYARIINALKIDQRVALGAAFGSQKPAPEPPEHVDEAVRILRELAQQANAGADAAAETMIAVGDQTWDLSAAVGSGPSLVDKSTAADKTGKAVKGLTDDDTADSGSAGDTSVTDSANPDAPADSLVAQLAATHLSALYKIAAEPPIVELSEGEKIWVGTAGYGGLRRYLPGDTVGSMGIEQRYNNELRGEHGLMVQSRLKPAERGANNEIIDGQEQDGPQAAPGCELVPGADIHLTIDPKWQRAAERALGQQKDPAVIIVMNANTGAIVCMATYPTFDPAAFAEHRNAEITALINDPATPLLNRAIQGLYAPGSIMKPVVSYGAFKDGVINTSFSIFCEGAVRNSKGVYMIGCHGEGHGQTDVVHALKKSCNCFYHFVAQKWSIDGLDAWLHDVGLGQRTGVDLPFENAGFIPSPEWKQTTWHEKWLTIETSHVMIGQGAVQVTPLQAAAMMAMVANGGKVIHPHVVEKPGADAIVRDLHVNPEYIRVVHQGLYECVNEIGGTAYKTFHQNGRLPVVLAGKTGTADVKHNGEHCVNSWFSGYFPADKPEYVVIGVVPFAPSGSAGGFVAGGLVKQTMDEALTGKIREK